MTEVLYLSYDGMTDPLGQSQVLPYLVGLSKEGYAFTLISFEKKERFDKDKSIIEEICRLNNIDWKPLFYTKKPPIFSTIKDVLKMNSLSKKLHKAKQFKLVHARGSYMTSIVALGLQNKFGIKYLFDMRGFWADERVEGGLWNLKKPHYSLIFNYFKRKEQLFLKQADAIVTLTQKAKSVIINWNLVSGDAEKKIRCIPCCADLELFDFNKYSFDNKKATRIKLGLSEDSTVFCYLGSIGTWYMLEEMMRFFEAYFKEDENASFLFITNENESYIRNKASDFLIPQQKIAIVFQVSDNDIAFRCFLFVLPFRKTALHQ